MRLPELPIPLRRWRLVAPALALAAALLACAGGGHRSESSTEAPAFTLQLLHVADMDSGGDLVANAPALSALVQHFRREYPANTLFVSSGDNHIPGPFFQAADDPSLSSEIGGSGAGRGDIQILNLMGLQASALGNHDLDQGAAFFASLIRPQGSGAARWPGALFPHLAANLDFGTEPALAPLVAPDSAEAHALAGRLAGSAVVTLQGERIGLVGASTPTLARITASGGITVRPASEDIDALAAEIQPRVDALLARGINKLVLLSHMQQIAVEQALATRLRGVDVIVAGGSNTRLFDANDRVRPGDSVQGAYPLALRSASGEPVLVVNVDADYKYLGRAVLAFDAAGRLLSERLDPVPNGAWATDAAGLARAGLRTADAQPGVAAIAARIGAVVAAKDRPWFGAARVYLEGDRSVVRNEESNLGHLCALANLAHAQALGERTAAVSLINGGNLRAGIGGFEVAAGANRGARAPTRANPAVDKLAGDISQLDIETALRFNNGLVALSVSAAELKGLLEHGLAVLGQQGRFPQIAGMRLSFDPARPSGARIRGLVVDDPDGLGPRQGPETVVRDGRLVVGAGTVYRLVTLAFLAQGGDGYPVGGLAAPQRVDLQGGSGFGARGTEQTALAEHLRQHHPRERPYAEADTAAAQDTRIQNLALRAEALP